MGLLGWLMTILGLVIGLVSLATLIGVFIPQGRVVHRSIVVNQPRDKVYAVIRDGKNWPQWWDILQAVEVLPADGPGEQWRLLYKDGNKFKLRIEDEKAPERIVLRIDDESALFGGTWVYELSQSDPGRTEVKLTENGEIYPPLIRFLAKMMMDPAQYVAWNLKGLAGHFGETAQVR